MGKCDISDMNFQVKKKQILKERKKTQGIKKESLFCTVVFLLFGAEKMKNWMRNI